MSLLATQKIYGETACEIPLTREGTPPQFNDLVLHYPSSESPMMTYTGDYHRVYKSHTLTVLPDSITVQLCHPPEYLGVSKDIYSERVTITPLSFYSNRQSQGQKKGLLNEDVTSIFRQFCAQEQERLSSS